MSEPNDLLKDIIQRRVDGPRNPSHYPVWIRELVFEPLFIHSMKQNPERNIETLYNIHCNTYRTDPLHALMFDMCIERERDAIKYDANINAMQSALADLRIRVSELESKLAGV